MAEELGVSGLKDLEKALLKLADVTTGKKALRNAFTFGSSPMLKDAKARAPYLEPDTNDVHIRDKLGRATTFPKTGMTILMRLGERKTKTVTASGGKKTLVYGHLLEFGGKPFLRPAFDANTKKFLDRFRQQLAKNIKKALK